MLFELKYENVDKKVHQAHFRMCLIAAPGTTSEQGRLKPLHPIRLRRDRSAASKLLVGQPDAAMGSIQDASRSYRVSWRDGKYVVDVHDKTSPAYKAICLGQ
ncbi:hypothetical protein NDN08_004254 [Rhodosorus marinus]|uniref:Uncharacterized protein n=1 Tax=Rhodosorus marinus TaxID=101924 RepID=A0AAV8UPT9_9RHOD|nr:hypothetical protein NDN08_004254 [Rhodosorus marinus]